MSQPIFMNEITDRLQQEQMLEEGCMKKCKIEIATPEGAKFISTLEGTFWRTSQELYVQLNPDSNVVLAPGIKYKATILGGNTIIGLVVEVKEITEKVIKLNYPEKVFKINRREAFRFQIPGAYQITAEIMLGGRKYYASLVDISVEGVGLWVNHDLWKVGTTIDQITFKLDNKEIYSSAEVRVVFPMEFNKDKGFKVGVKLVKPASGSQTTIVNYINRNVSQYAKKLTDNYNVTVAKK
jgi:c-di-GMP-binding flagellar brake protein YcgR